MTPEKHIKISTTLIFISICIEAAFISQLRVVNDIVYTLIHLSLVVVLFSSQFLLYQKLKEGNAKKYALFFSIGTAFTTIGDYINSSISFVSPISGKLCCALFLFGTGYTLYNIALWKASDSYSKISTTNYSKKKWLIILPILVINIFSWFMDVESNVKVSSLLYYGSFVFNATIYVAMPLFAFWYFACNNWNIKGLLVFLGAIIIPYSDLVLFNSWLKNGTDNNQTTLIFYSANWIVYFTGQVLISLFPSFIAIDEYKK